MIHDIISARETARIAQKVCRWGAVKCTNFRSKDSNEDDPPSPDGDDNDNQRADEDIEEPPNNYTAKSGLKKGQL